LEVSENGMNVEMSKEIKESREATR